MAPRSSPSTPYRSPTARRADWHIQPRPGTDAALALALMHVIWRDGLEDRDYLEQATVGSELLRERALTEYPPDRVAAITGVDVATIEELARRYATEHPSLIRLNYGLQRHGGGGMAVRTITCLPAIVGAWRHRGGGTLLSTSGTYGLNALGLTRPDLAPAGTRTININRLGEALLGELPGPPVRALYVYNCNPAAVAPDQSKVLAGLAREDLFTVVHELFPTDTVDYADVVLPATSQLEHEDIHGSYGHHYVIHNPPAIPPRGESRSNADVFRALADRMGFEPDLFPDDAELIRTALDGGPALEGITPDRLRLEGSVRLNIPEDYRPFADGRFPTPSGKCELYSERMARDGLDPPALLHAAPRGPDDPARPGRPIPAPAREPAPPAVPQLDLRQLRLAPARRRRPDRRALPRGRRRPGARGRRPRRGLQRSRPLPRPGRADRIGPTRHRREPRHLLAEARPRRQTASTPPPPPPSPTWAAARPSSTTSSRSARPRPRRPIPASARVP